MSGGSFHWGFCGEEIGFVNGFVLPDTLYSGSTPRVSCLKLFCCDISWTSPLLKGLRYLEIHRPSSIAKPTLAAWLDALDELPQFETLVLNSAFPIAQAPPFPFNAKRTAALPSLIHLEISASTEDCALTLAHLDLPALTELHIIARFHRGSDDVPRLIPHVVRHAHGPQDAQPLQSVLIRTDGYRRVNILAWSVPNIDVEVEGPLTFLAETLPPRVALSFSDISWSHLTPATSI